MPKNNGAGEVLFASSHFAFERKGRSSQDGEGESYTLTDLDGVTVGSSKAWSWTFANVSLRKLFEASLATGNPIRWS